MFLWKTDSKIKYLQKCKNKSVHACTFGKPKFIKIGLRNL